MLDRLPDTKKTTLKGHKDAVLRWSDFAGKQRPLTAPVADAFLYAQSSVLVLGDQLVYAFGNQVWVLEEASGKILGQTTLKHNLTQALVGEDGHFYGVGEGQVLSLGLPEAKLRWTTTYANDEGYSDVIKAFTGPRDSVLALMYKNEGGGTWGKGQIIGVDTTSGEIRWRQKHGNLNAAHLVMVNGVVAVDNWKKGTWYDPKSGEKIGGHPVDFDMGGCSYPTYTQDYMIRGLSLHSLNNPEDILIGDGTRPHCQNPVYPAYGHLFVPGTGCGCSVFFRSGISSHYPADDFEPTPPEARLMKGMKLKVMASKLTPTPMDSLLVKDWKNAQGFNAGGKRFNYNKMLASVRKDQVQTAGKGHNTYGGSNKYGNLLNPRVEKDGWLVTSLQHSNIVEAYQGEDLQ